MALRDEDGNVLSKSAVTALLTGVVPDDAEFTVGSNVYEDTGFRGSSERGVELKWRAGQVVKQSEIDAAYSNPTVASVTPAVGAAAGGTQVTITGKNFQSGIDQNPNQGPVSGGDVAGVTIGAACTNVQVVSDTEITCTTPAHAAGAVNVVVNNRAGQGSKANSFTFQ